MLTKELEKILIDKALEARDNSYSPYSKFPVGAALLTKNDEIFIGTNVENSSIGLTICAERSAICAAVSNGDREFRTLVVAGPLDDPVSPCGACRQFMCEFGDFEVIIYSENEIIRTTTKKLLPFDFKLEL
jgi:cytidine deaminase